jgi:threonine/homoserine/homoserine lactone efflux protein
MRWMGATYLLWLGGRTLWSIRRHVAIGVKTRHISAFAAVREGMINNMLNPKPLLFMFAFLPQFVDVTQGSAVLQLVVLGLTQKVCGLLVEGSVALVCGAAGNWLLRRSKLVALLELFAGIIMIGLGLFLIVGDATKVLFPGKS